MHDDSLIEQFMKHYGLPYRPCGLNANWNCQAWHLGPSTTPNKHKGDYYILDREDGTFGIAKSSAVEVEEPRWALAPTTLPECFEWLKDNKKLRQVPKLELTKLILSNYTDGNCSFETMLERLEAEGLIEDCGPYLQRVNLLQNKMVNEIIALLEKAL